MDPIQALTDSDVSQETMKTLDTVVQNIFSAKIVGIVLTLVIGYFAVKIIMHFLKKGLEHSRIDRTVHAFLKSLVKILLYTIILIIVADMAGIPVTSFLALLSVLGLAVSLAVKDSLTNLAGGLIILLAKPYKVGDYIEAEGISGTVQDIGLVYTRLNTIDNKGIFVPNGALSNAKIINYSAEENRRLDLTFSIGYSCDFELAKRLIRGVLAKNERALTDPDPLVRVSEHGDNAVSIAVKVWVKAEEYWNLYYDLHEEVKSAFDKGGISIPFPQLDVHFPEGAAK